MTTIRIETTIEKDGELHLRQLPCRKGDRVAAILLIPGDADQEGSRDEARQRFLALARAARFRSAAPYPSRDELHERH
jgi:hypothetical protein